MRFFSMKSKLHDKIGMSVYVFVITKFWRSFLYIKFDSKGRLCWYFVLCIHWRNEGSMCVCIYIAHQLGWPFLFYEIEYHKLRVEGKIVVSKYVIKRLVRMTVFFSFPSDHRNNPRNLLNIIFMNYIAACSFLPDTDVEEKGRIFLLQGNKLALLFSHHLFQLLVIIENWLKV